MPSQPMRFAATLVSTHLGVVQLLEASSPWNVTALVALANYRADPPVGINNLDKDTKLR
jgi:hypothetical protein